MSDVIVEANPTETVIEIEGGPVLTTTVSDSVQMIVSTQSEPIIIDLNSGARGEPGSTILTGPAYPNIGMGSNGDIFIVTEGDVAPGLVLRKIEGVWVERGNIRGPAGGINSVNGYIGPDVELDKTDIGLDFVDNTSDLSKPVSTATQLALDAIDTEVDTKANDNEVVKLSGNQTVAGVKTFTSAPLVPFEAFPIDRVQFLGDTLDSTVRLSGNQEISGTKTFTAAPVVPDNSFAVAKITGLSVELGSKANNVHTHVISSVTGLQAALDSKEGVIAAGTTAQYRRGDNTWQTLNLVTVDLTSTQTIAGVKTFSVSPIVPTPTADMQAATKKYIDDAILVLTNGSPALLNTLDELAAALGDDPNFAVTVTNSIATKVSLTGAETIAGTKTFSSAPVVPDASFAIAKTSGLQTALDSKQATIVAGTTAQYWRGDKSWQTLDKTAVGLSNVNNAAQVEIAGTQTITGAKTFSLAPVVPDASFAIAKTSGLQSALDAKAPLASPAFTGTVTGTFSGTGTLLTALNASNLASGTVAQARLVQNVVRVIHGTTASTARPTGATYVEWIGSVSPTNATANDTWWNA